ncbi:DUF4145 domain-containing protein [Nocardia sp. A7]|uniref:DUF4145 domain-containing protein n=1 Tax=Nocardia sp. A7 TaxID=2789274 RepID=UPI00397B910D
MKEQVRRLATRFLADDWPILDCPVCRVGHLAAKPSDITCHNSAESVRYADGDPTTIRGTMWGHLTCTNPSCGDAVAVGGDVSVDLTDETVYNYADLFQTFYQVRVLYPAIRVVDVPDGTPQSVDAALVDAAAVAWQNPSAAIGLLRTSVERLMDAYAIPAQNQDGRYRSLHARLEDFKAKEPEAAKPLLATKWVGNQGIHLPADMSIETFLDVAEFIELALDLLYQHDTSAVRERIERILASKRLVD